MASIISAGIGSGIDVNGLVTQLVQSQGASQLTQLSTKEASLQSQLSAVGTIKGALSGLQSSLSGLKNLSSFQSLTATSNNTALFSASAVPGATAGTHSVEVKNIAAAQRLVSKAVSDTTTSVGTGVLTFQLGTYDSTTNTFTANPDQPSSSVTIDSSNNSLEGIRNAVNGAKIGVSASIVNDGTGNRLVFGGNATGAASSLQITVTGDGDTNNTDDAGLSQLAFNPTGSSGSGKNLTQTVEAKDASLMIDGLAVTSAANTITTAIPGITLNLLSASKDNPATLTVSRGISGVANNVQTFVDKYNSFANSVKNLASYDAVNKKGGILLGDSTLLSIDNQIKSTLNGTVSGTGGYDSLVSLGITSKKDGTLSLDSAQLATALSNDPDAVGKVFSAAGTPSDALVTYQRSTTATQAGQYAVQITQAATRGVYAGAAPSSPTLTVDSDNDTFSLKVNGTQSGSIALTQKTYASNADLASEMQNRINADSALKASGVSVLVAYDTDHFAITSSRYGTASKVEITGVDTNTTAGIGLSVATGTAGKDVSGTINGQTASGYGQLLTSGAGDSTGLQLQVRGSTTGSRGNVAFTRGVADKLDTLLSGFLGNSGLLNSRQGQLNTRIQDIGTQRTRVNEQLTKLEARYRTQFNNMDSLVGSLKNTGNYLTKQFSSSTG
ncbi:flagellar hook-associated protein 2 [Gammaproteobacteria bacterium]